MQALATRRDGRIAVHLRAPDLPGGALQAAAARFRAAYPHLPLWINDRVDVAAAVGADGVQLGQGSLAVDEARACLPPSVTVGASVHDVAEATAGRVADADLLVVGTVYASASHPGRPGAGPALLERIARVDGRPLVAIGGVTPARVAEVRAAGAWGVAVQRGVWEAPDPLAAVDAYLDCLLR